MTTEINHQNRDLAESVAAVRDGAKNLFDKGAERAAEIKHAAVDRASVLKHSAMERGGDAVSTIQRTIEERPIAVLGGVFLGGLLLGMWLRR